MESRNPAKAVKDAVETAVEKVADALTSDIPGAPGSATPPVDEPTAPQDPLPPKTEQGTPETRTPTGADLDGVKRGAPGGVLGRHGAAADRPAWRDGGRRAGAADVRHRPVGRVRRAAARRRAGSVAGRVAGSGTPRPPRPTRPPWTRASCFWSRSAGGTPKRSKAWGAGVSVLQEAGVAGTPGVVTAESGAEAFAGLQQLLPAHRVWERFPASVA